MGHYSKCTLWSLSLCMLLHIILVCRVGELSSDKWPFAITFRENGGWGIFRAGHIFERLRHNTDSYAAHTLPGPSYVHTSAHPM